MEKISLYSITVPVFVKSLNQLDHLLTKAESHVAEKGLDANTILQAQLASDQFNFIRQIQIVSDNAKGCVARLAGMTPPSMEDTETTFEELHARIAKTIAFVESVTAENLAGGEDRKIQIPYHEGYLFGYEYVAMQVIPNFFFHMVTAYSILRNQGVQIGKADYRGALPMKPIEA